jgi:hypothetical protein
MIFPYGLFLFGCMYLQIAGNRYIKFGRKRTGRLPTNAGICMILLSPIVLFIGWGLLNAYNVGAFL